MAKDKELVVTGAASTALILIPNVNELLLRKMEGFEEDDYEGAEDAKRGMENIQQHEQRIPIIRILDPKSPQAKPVSAGGIPGAQGGGAIFNTSTGQIYNGEKGLYIVAAYRYEKYVNYVKRNEDGSGGGFKGILDPTDPIVKQRQAERLADVGDLFGRLPNGVDDDDNELELTQTFYIPCICIVPMDDGSLPPLEMAEFFRALVPFSSTQIKKYQSFIERNNNIFYMMRQADGVRRPTNPAIWSHVWRLTTVYESKGTFSWYGWNIKLAVVDDKGVELNTKMSRLDPKGDLYTMGRDLCALFESGEAQPEYEKDIVGEQATRTGPNSGGGNGRGTDDIPFGQQS